MKRAFVILVLAALLAAEGCSRGDAAPGEKSIAQVRRDEFVVWVAARGKVNAQSNVTIAPPRWWGLKIGKLVAKEGDKVKKDDVLMILETENLEEAIRDRQRDINSSQGALDSVEANLKSETDRLNAVVRKAEEDIAKAKAAYEDLKNLPLATDLRNAEIDLETRQKAAEQARIRFENMGVLYEKGGGVSLQQLEQRELEYRSADTDCKRAELQFQLIRQGATQEELRDAKITIELAELGLEQARRTQELTLAQLNESVNKAKGRLDMNKGNLGRVERIMADCTMRAPVSGTVFYNSLWTPNGNEKIKEGMEVRPWNRLIDLPDTTRMQIIVEVEEQDIGRVQSGQAARIVLDAYRSRQFNGKVTRIEPVTKRKGGRESGRADNAREDLGTKVVEAIITFDENDEQIRTGLNGRAEIQTQSKAAGLVVPREAVFSVNGADVVYLVEGGELKETPVKVGGRSEKDALILSGVKEGDHVSLVQPNGDKRREGR